MNAGGSHTNPRCAGKENSISAATPSPDLAIEVETTNPLVSCVGILEAMGIPELWRHDGYTIRFLVLGSDG